MSISHSYHQLLYRLYSIPQHQRNKMLCWLPCLSTIIIAIIITNSTFTSFCFQTITFTSVESIPHMDPVVYLYYRPIKTKKSFFLLPDDFTKTPIKNNRYEYSYYILTTQPAKNEYYSFTLKYCRTNEYDCLFEGEDTIVNQQYSFLHIFIICSLLKQ